MSEEEAPQTLCKEGREWQIQGGAHPGEAEGTGEEAAGRQWTAQLRQEAPETKSGEGQQRGGSHTAGAPERQQLQLRLLLLLFLIVLRHQRVRLRLSAGRGPTAVTPLLPPRHSGTRPGQGHTERPGDGAPHNKNPCPIPPCELS